MFRLNLLPPLLFSLFLSLHPTSHAQPPPTPSIGPPALSEVLTISVSPPNEILTLLFPVGLLQLQTPLAIRHGLILSIGAYEVDAACHPIALSYFGVKDSINRSFCDPTSKLIISRYIDLRLLQSQFPFDATALALFLARVGLSPFDTSTDTDNMVGWANVIAARAVAYFESDGWNSEGDLSRDDYRMPFDDYTGYKPLNPGNVKATKIEFPLRWQPLRYQADRRGNFAVQEHVVPHLGWGGAKPLVLSEEQFQQKKVSSPYVSPNRKGSFGKTDRKRIMTLIDKLFKRMANLDTRQVALAYWWENKVFSLGGIVAYYYENEPIIPLDQVSRVILGEVSIQHDAVLLAWKEKRRHDLVRPLTVIRRLLKGKVVRAYKSFAEGAGMVKADEWEPLIPMQPHSEFPSASATICTASLDHLEIQLTKLLGNSSAIPVYNIVLPPFTIPFSPVDKPMRIRFRTLREAARSCGRSRLLAGVHFAPSVPAGFELGSGIGKIAYKHMQDLWEGRVPDNCARCLKG